MLIYCNVTVQYYNFYSIIILQNTFFKMYRFYKNLPYLKLCLKYGKIEEVLKIH